MHVHRSRARRHYSRHMAEVFVIIIRRDIHEVATCWWGGKVWAMEEGRFNSLDVR